MELDVVYNEDCLIGMDKIPDRSVDLIICDLPYGITECKWDIPLPFEDLWRQYKRIIRENRAILLFGAEPFSSKLRLSNLEWFKYDIIWDKRKVSGFTNAKLKPLSRHEVISVFSNGKTANGSKNNMLYNPQGLVEVNRVCKNLKRIEGEMSFKRKTALTAETYVQKFTNYPTTIIQFDRGYGWIHPTQKPLPLLEYLIRTYSNEGEVVLDNCIGSGSTAIAAMNTNRHFIGFEKEKKFFDGCCERIKTSFLESL